MSTEKNLGNLLSRIESCLKCYERFREYNKEDRIRIRHWYNECPWFFPPMENSGVKGFLGSGKAFFVCQRPSTRGGIPSRADICFYDLMKKNGFEDAHVTDIVKCRERAGEISTREIENCFPYLKEEIQILRPKLIVAVGEQVYDVLANKFWSTGPRIEKIMHYSHAFRYNRVEELEEQFRSIQNVYRKLPDASG